jgi:hypothetical protein
VNLGTIAAMALTYSMPSDKAAQEKSLHGGEKECCMVLEAVVDAGKAE